ATALQNLHSRKSAPDLLPQDPAGAVAREWKSRVRIELGSPESPPLSPEVPGIGLRRHEAGYSAQYRIDIPVRTAQPISQVLELEMVLWAVPSRCRSRGPHCSGRRPGACSIRGFDSRICVRSAKSRAESRERRYPGQILSHDQRVDIVG